jgi:hypothetical protein
VPLSDDLDRLDVSIRQLQVKWDMFFSGAEKKPPTDLHAQVEGLVKRYANSEIRNNGERFRYQSLTARFTTFNELWQKRLRAREEGKAFGVHGLKADQLPPPAAPAPPRPRTEARAGGPGGEYRVADPARDTLAVRSLYERFVDERRRAGVGAAPPFEQFQQLIARQTARIRSEKGARAVDFRLETRDGKVSLKARLVK